MDKGVEILNELLELNSILAKMEKVNVFTVPEGYFDTLATAILLSCKGETGQEVPAGYFDQLADNILNKIKAQQAESSSDELRKLSPMLYSIQDSNVFEVPAGYFNSIAGDVMDKLQPKAKVVKMSLRGSFMKYAAAAVVVIFLTLGVFKFVHKPAGNTNELAAVALDPAIQRGSTMTDEQFNKALDSLSTDEIAGYLEKNGNESDIAELSANIADSTLPTQEDYILDRTALEKYLTDDNVK